MQPTPQAASEIGAILRVGFCYNGITIYDCGAAHARTVGRATFTVIPATM
jgi:hypothetical protein